MCQNQDQKRYRDGQDFEIYSKYIHVQTFLKKLQEKLYSTEWQ